MGRKILFITTDQQRYDALRCNGGLIARTPAADALAAAGVRFERAYAQNTVCMPARSTILTGQYPRTHGVIANGIPLPVDAPSVAAVLRDAGYRTALIGKAHFEPVQDPDGKWEENRLSREGRTGPYRGFEHVEFAGHGPYGSSHYNNWLTLEHPDKLDGFVPTFDASPGGETGAPEINYNPVPREAYHTDWIAERVVAWLDTLDPDDDWFCWVSFPDPHHPWDPPASERHRVDWRDLDLPAGHPGSADRVREVLADKPAHWLAWYEGRVPNVDAAPGNFIPAQLTGNQLREISALIHIENEMLDEACARIIGHVESRDWGADTDIVLSTDHGEFQGDFGLLYKGPYHVDSLMRLPLIWRPAPSAGVVPAVVSEPVGQVDLAATFCQIAGVAVPEWMEGEPLPTAPGSGRERALCEWDSQLDNGYRMRTIIRDGWICTVYEASLQGWGLSSVQRYHRFGVAPPQERIVYDGTEGELYNLVDDPHQWRNRWNDPALVGLRSDLVADLYDSLVPPRIPGLTVQAMA
ncbi:sulfatase [Rhodococcus sp. WS3]|uniref:sulfatase family protein n=1 Tax=Rhodococcus sp. WS3 TaxID=2486271 RepID=UPI0011415419|nr:sulfatase-like hydrolase/transferase [Rhodococcus sp. WS3]ROZ46692.1 sulfatase [Rhodococcus sp. WS3]